MFLLLLDVPKKTRMVRVIILCVHISGIARSADSLFGMVTNLDNKEFKRIYLSANACTLCIAFLLLGNLF